MHALLDDVRIGLRSLRRAPGFAATAVVVLGAGIAVNAAIFSLFNALLLKPLGGTEPGTLAGVYLRDERQPAAFRHFSYEEYIPIREHPGAMSSVLAHAFTTVAMGDGDGTRKALVSLVSSNYMQTLGVRPTMGRDFDRDEERVGAEPVAIASDLFWRKGGSDPRLVGSKVRVNGRELTIIGVAPRGFSGATALVTPDLWLPLGACAFTSPGSSGADAANCLGAADGPALALVGRLRHGASRAQAAASLPPPITRSGRTTRIEVAGVSRLSIGASPEGDAEVGAAMLFVSGLAASVLLIAAMNLANMLLARSTSRRRELAVRLALGATRWQAVRLLVVESGLLAGAGCTLGLGAAVAVGARVAAWAATVLPFGIVFDASPDWRVVAATLGYALAAALVATLGPALAAARPDSLTHLRDQAGQSRRGAGRLAGRHALAVGQLAVSLALLTGAAVFGRGALDAARQDPGLVLDGQLVATVAPGLSGYDEPRGRAAYADALAALRRDPAVLSASLSSSVPFSPDVEGAVARDAAGPGSEGRLVLVSSVGSEYFRTLGVPVLRGREFDAAEELTPSSHRVMVNQVLARRLWPRADPIGRQIQIESGETWGLPLEVVGVVAAISPNPVEGEPPAQVYLPFGSAYHGEAHLHARLRSAGAEAAGLQALRTTLRQLDPSLAVLRVDTLRGHRQGSIHLWAARAAAGLFAAFGGTALLLAALGVYGVKAYLVSRRRKELAIRMAVGASRGQILSLVAGDGAAVTAVGLGIGFGLSVALSRVLASWLPVRPGFDPLPAAAAVVLAGVMLLACWVPVRRATAEDPWSVLRAD